MQRKLYIPFILLSLALLLVTCSEESSPQFEADNFTRVYDNNQFNSLYSPVDIKQTPDGGYLILASMRIDTVKTESFYRIYILKADKYGKFVKELEVDPQYSNAVPDLIAVGEQYYFVCMDQSVQAKLMTVSADGDIVATADMGLTYPMAVALDGTGLVCLSYNHFDKKTVISTVNTSGIVGTSQSFDLGAGGEDDIQNDIIESFMINGRKLPYFVGRIPGSSYYFNGFLNYTLSLAFTSLSGANAGGIVQGQQNNGGMSALVPLGAGKFAAARFNFAENYLIPNLPLETNSTHQATDLGGLNLPEVTANSAVKILRATVNDKNVIIYAVNTESRQIGLLFYDEATGAFIGSRYLGFSNPYEIGSLIQTEDGGLAVTGTTYVAGRFARICLFKFSSAELAKNVNK